MTPKKNWIIVQADFEQKGKIKIAEQEFKTATLFNNNHREKNPVAAIVINGNGCIDDGSMIICHHNFFYERSPYQLTEDIFAIKFNDNIFACVDENGEAHPVLNNLIAENIPVSSKFTIPVSLQKNYLDRAKVIEGTGYKNGDLIFVIPYSCYEMVYYFEGQERRIIKINKDDIVGKLKESN